MRRRWGRCPWMQALPVSKHPTFLHCSAAHRSGMKGERRTPPFLSQRPVPRETLPIGKHRMICQLWWIRDHVFWYYYLFLINALLNVYSLLCICDWVLVEARRIFDFHCSTRTLSWGTWDLVLWLGIEPGPSALGAGSQPLGHQGSPNTVIFNEKI